MNKNFIIDYERNKILISCGPEISTECEEWYPKYFDQSIGDYVRIVTEYLQYIKQKAYLLSYYDPCRELTRIEKKEGMTGIFRRLKQEYQSDSEKIIERDWKSIILSATDFIGTNKKLLFHIAQPRSILCVGEYITSDNLLTFEMEKGVEVFREKFFQYGSLIIQYNDVSCDGNNIVFNFDNGFFKLKELVNILISNGFMAMEDL